MPNRSLPHNYITSHYNALAGGARAGDVRNFLNYITDLTYITLQYNALAGGARADDGRDGERGEEAQGRQEQVRGAPALLLRILQLVRLVRRL